MATQNSRTGEELSIPELLSYLKKFDLGISSIVHVKQFKNGFSNLTYRIDTDNGRFVLRRPPHGPRAQKAHDVAREYRVLTALQPVFAKAPKVKLLCEDETIIGAPFYLMECIEGEIIRQQSSSSLQLSPKQRSQASRALINTLSELHSLDISSNSLVNLGRPEGYITRQVEGWIGRIERAKTNNISIPESLLEYLRSEQPTDLDGRLVHNDYKFDNVVFAPSDYSEVVAVLDWEMCTVGNPLLDVGLTLAYWAHKEEVQEMPFLGVNETHLPGCWRRNDLVAAYKNLSGLTQHELLYPYVFGNFKIAGIVQQIYARFAAGHTQDPRFAQLHHVVNYLLKRAQHAITVGSIE